MMNGREPSFIHSAQSEILYLFAFAEVTNGHILPLKFTKVDVWLKGCSTLAQKLKLTVKLIPVNVASVQYVEWEVVQSDAGKMCLLCQLSYCDKG